MLYVISSMTKRMAAFVFACKFQASIIALQRPATALFFGNYKVQIVFKSFFLTLIAIVTLLYDKTYVYNFIGMIQFRKHVAVSENVKQIELNHI